MNVRITSDGNPRGTRVRTEDGQDILASAATWHADVKGMPTAEITLPLVAVEVEGHVTRWHGLEDVPSDVLRDELAKRGSED